VADAASVLQIVVTLAIFIFSAKLLGALAQRFRQPSIIGELMAGMIVGPFAIGGLLVLGGVHLVVLDETVLHVGEIAAIVILFVAGMQITPREFLKLGVPSFTIGALGVVVPFFAGYFVFISLGVDVLASIIVATALTATSIAISVQVLYQLGRLHSREGRMILGAAVADDVLGIAVLSVVLTMTSSGVVSFDPGNVVLLLLQVLGLYALLVVVSVLAIPRMLNSRLWGTKPGGAEAAATASMFAVSGAAAFAGLSPIVGAFAAGMAVTGARAIKQIREFAEKLDFIFAPLFFAIIGARIDLRGLNSDIVVLGLVIVAVAVGTKLAGCGLPSMIFLKDKRKAAKVGIGMISRGEVGLIVAAAGASAGILSGNMYTAVVLMVAVSTVITPIWLKFAYRKEPPESPMVEQQGPAKT
jgi:Kef-type K+ transport system membrane component KefB